MREAFDAPGALVDDVVTVHANGLEPSPFGPGESREMLSNQLMFSPRTIERQAVEIEVVCPSVVDVGAQFARYD